MLPKAFKIYVSVLSLAIVALVAAIVVLGQKHDTPPIAERSSMPVPVTEEPTPSPSNQSFYPVVDVVDGDTLKVDIGGKTETLRLIGIDTPETVDPRKSVQCFGREASAEAKRMLSGKRVRLEADPTQGERDKYGRLLRYLYLEDGTFFNKYMVSEGYAHEYTYQSNPYKYQAEFKQAERDAMTAQKGLWSPSTCNGVTASGAPESTVEPTESPRVMTIGDDGVDYDCKDFKSHEEAQAYFDAQGGSPTNNVDRLDADHDGLACE